MACISAGLLEQRYTRPERCMSFTVVIDVLVWFNWFLYACIYIGKSCLLIVLFTFRRLFLQKAQIVRAFSRFIVMWHRFTPKNVRFRDCQMRQMRSRFRSSETPVLYIPWRPWLWTGDIGCPMPLCISRANGHINPRANGLRRSTSANLGVIYIYIYWFQSILWWNWSESQPTSAILSLSQQLPDALAACLVVHSEGLLGAPGAPEVQEVPSTAGTGWGTNLPSSNLALGRRNLGLGCCSSHPGRHHPGSHHPGSCHILCQDPIFHRPAKTAQVKNWSGHLRLWHFSTLSNNRTMSRSGLSLSLTFSLHLRRSWNIASSLKQLINTPLHISEILSIAVPPFGAWVLSFPLLPFKFWRSADTCQGNGPLGDGNAKIGSLPDPAVPAAVAGGPRAFPSLCCWHTLQLFGTGWHMDWQRSNLQACQTNLRPDLTRKKGEKIGKRKKRCCDSILSHQFWWARVKTQNISKPQPGDDPTMKQAGGFCPISKNTARWKSSKKLPGNHGGCFTIYTRGFP